MDKSLDKVQKEKYDYATGELVQQSGYGWMSGDGGGIELSSVPLFVLSPT